MKTPGQFHFLICLCSQKGGLEGSQPHPQSLALPTSGPARLTGSQGGGGLNPCTWAAASLLRQVSEATPGISHSRKRGWEGGAWPLGPVGRRKKRRALPSCRRSLRGSEGTGQDAGRAELRSTRPEGRVCHQPAAGLPGPGGQAPLHIGLQTDTWLPRNPQDLSLDVRSDLSSARWAARAGQHPSGGLPSHSLM